MNPFLFLFLLLPLFATAQEYPYHNDRPWLSGDLREQEDLARQYQLRSITSTFGRFKPVKKDTMKTDDLEVETVAFDSLFRVSYTISADGIRGTFFYDEEGHCTRYVSGNDVQMEYFYDAGGRLTQRISYVNDTCRWETDFSYDKQNRLQQVKNYSLAYGKYYHDVNDHGPLEDSVFYSAYEYEYDAGKKSGRARMVHPVPSWEKPFVAMEFDENGFMKLEKYTGKNNGYCKYDKAGHVIEECLGNPKTMPAYFYSYDEKNNRLSYLKKEPGKKDYRLDYIYNTEGKLVMEKMPDGVANWYYDANGLRVKRVMKLSGSELLWITKFSYAFQS